MSYIPLGALADFVTLGPQYYTTDRPNAVQVIQRGPHGMRFAADPVRTREGKIRGSGFRFWNEQQVMRPDEKWYPREKVVGLMGLGQEPPDIERLARCPSSAPVPPSLVEPSDPRSPAASLRRQLVESMQAACHGRQDAAQAALRGAQYFMVQLPVSERGVWQQEAMKAQSYIKSLASVAPELKARQEEKEIDYARAMQEYNVKYAGSRMEQERRYIEEAKEEARKKAETGCYSWDVGCQVGEFAKKHWWKFALGAGALLFFYGAGKGVGSGVMRRLGGD